MCARLYVVVTVNQYSVSYIGAMSISTSFFLCVCIKRSFAPLIILKYTGYSKSIVILLWFSLFCVLEVSKIFTWTYLPFYLFIVGMWTQARGSTWSTIRVWRSEDAFQSHFSLSTMWISELEPRWLGVVASAFIPRAILRAYFGVSYCQWTSFIHLIIFSLGFLRQGLAT